MIFADGLTSVAETVGTDPGSDLAVISVEDLLTYITGETSVGQTITLSVLRDSEKIEVSVELSERPTAEG